MVGPRGHPRLSFVAVGMLRDGRDEQRGDWGSQGLSVFGKREFNVMSSLCCCMSY